MKRRWIALGLGLTLTLGIPALSGCESINQAIRHQGTGGKDKSDGDGEDGKDKVTRISSDAPKGFFSNSRLSGAMSSEGRDIEKSLGVQ